jgi:hypothetical protein
MKPVGFKMLMCCLETLAAPEKNLTVNVKKFFALECSGAA